MLQDFYRVTDEAQSFVTSDDASDVIDATGPGKNDEIFLLFAIVIESL